MLRIVLTTLLFFIFTLFSVCQDCHCLKPVFEIGLGPLFTFPVITAHQVGIVGNEKPKTGTTVNYSLHLGVRTHPAAFQVGLELIQDRQKFNVYLPLYWPSQEKSHWNNYYTAYQLGLGANIRYHFGLVYVQIGGAIKNEVSHETKSEIIEPGGDPIPSPGAMYTSKPGGQLSAIAGLAWSDQSRFTTSVGFVHDTGEYEFKDEMYLHQWKVRTYAISISVQYQLNKI